MLHDPEDLPGAGLAQDSAVARRLGDLGGEHGDGVAVSDVRPQQLGQGGAVQQRDVTGEDHDRSLEGRLVLARRRVQGSERALHRPAGAGNGVLVGHEDLGIELDRMGCHQVPLVAHHHDQPLRLQ